jgi:hypothetical protein
VNSLDRRPQHAADLLKNSATPVVIAVPLQTRRDPAANDAAATERRNDLNLFQNPLWIMAIALGVFCAFTASVIALG